VDDVLVSTQITPPYSYTSALAIGAHTVFTKAYDAAGNIGTSAEVSFTVKDAIVPTVQVTSPTNGSTVPRSTTVTIQATASDNVGVAKVEFYVSNVLKCTDVVAPYSCAWPVPARKGVSYTILGKAYDAANNTATHTVTVTSK
ncbi:MAG: Ig-like domain-containing protein, partial [bacterium]|nr:Ig-like domain-containing protein [bacterium]